MKNIIKWLIIALVLVAVIAGASILYGSLTEEENEGGGFITDVPTDEIKKPSDKNANESTDGSQASESGQPSADASDTSEGSVEIDKPNAAPHFFVINGDAIIVNYADVAEIGKPIIINFWASWCPPCAAELPDFEAMYKKYGDRVEFMMINMTDGYQETLEKAYAHVSKNGYTFPVYYDIEGDAGYAYNVMNLPATYVIDAEGNIVAHAIGKINAKALEDAIGLVID